MENWKRLWIIFFLFFQWKIILKYYIDYLIFIIPSIHSHSLSLQYAHFDYKLIVNALNKNFNVLLSLNLTTLSISIRHISLILTRSLLKWAEIGVLHVIASTNWLIIHIISIVIAILRTYALPTFSIIWWNTSTIKMACLILAGVCLTLRINIAPLSPNTECQ